MLQIKSWIPWNLFPYIKNETIFLAVFCFFCIFVRSSWCYTKMKPFFSPFLKFHFPPYLFMIYFRDIYNTKNSILKPNFSPFLHFFIFRRKILHFETIFLAVFTIITFSRLRCSPKKVVTMHFSKKILPYFSPFLKFCYQIFFLCWFHQKMKPYFSPFFIILF